ncbi:hypothetical protein PybrP1_007586 [[Pythium] brassicae (nom. inval.)]|nr:hypothetical protein PybrP1_007586 [[Pythium] brassicae (nom. inval.)]
MKKLRIPGGEIANAVEHGSIDWLAIIPPYQVTDRGLPFAKRQLRERIHSKLFPYSATKQEIFCSYFERQWLRRVPPELWSKHSIDPDEITQTNNPLERFNRELNDRFSSAHPSLARFVSVIETISRERVQLLHDIQFNRAQVPRRVIEWSRALSILDKRHDPKARPDQNTTRFKSSGRNSNDDDPLDVRIRCLVSRIRSCSSPS